MIKKYRIPLAFMISAIWIFLIYRCTGIFFETNDDRIITEIFSGSMTGFPEAHTYYIDYILGFLLSSLYRISTAIPWYGGMLVLFQFLCCFFTADAFLSRCKNQKNILIALAIVALLYAAGLYVIASIQYTSTAALLAITGYLCFLLYPQEKSRCILFFTLEFLSFLLRSNAMLMIQPMGFLVLCGLCNPLFSFPLCKPRSPKKLSAKYRPLFYAIAILSSILIIGKCSYSIFHSTPGWKEYKKVNDAVTEITDYAAIPNYADVQLILQKYNVTEKQYNAFLQYAMIEENLSGDCLLEIAEVAHAQNVSPSLPLIFRQFLHSYTTHEYWNLNLLLLASWTILLIYIVFKKVFCLLFPLAGLLLSRSALWLFLLYEGRVPPRVMVPLYLSEIIFLLCLFFLAISKNDEDDNTQIPKNSRLNIMPDQKTGITYIIKHQLPVLLVLMLLPFGLKTLKSQYLHVSAKNATESIYFQGIQDMISYCNNHPEKHYFIDASTLIYYRGSAFETKIYGPRNGVITGCWYSGAPVLYQYEKNYFSACDSIYLITSSDMEMQSGMVIDYLEERLEVSAYLEDVFTVSNGGKYLVYAFSL